MRLAKRHLELAPTAHPSRPGVLSLRDSGAAQPETPVRGGEAPGAPAAGIGLDTGEHDPRSAGPEGHHGRRQAANGSRVTPAALSCWPGTCRRQSCEERVRI